MLSGDYMFINRFRVLGSLSLILANSPVSAQSIGLTDVDSLATSTFIYGLSADGSVAIGTAGAGQSRSAFRYTASGGVQDLGVLSGQSSQGLPFSYAFASGISADGTVIVGKSADSADFGQAYRWTLAGGMVGLAYLNGGSNTIAYAASRDGSVIVGTANDGADASQEKAVMWTGPLYAIQTLGLGKLDSAAPYPTSVSGDGTKVVGYAFDGTNSYAWRWNRGDANISKFMPVGFTLGYSDASAISQDGTAIVGTVSRTNDQNNLQAYVYKNSTLTLLGLLNGSASASAYSYGNGVNQDGTVVVGQATDGANADRLSAYRWSAPTGMQSIEQWLISKGVAVNPTSPYAANAAGVSADGCVISGQLSNSHGFIASGCSGIGMIDKTNFQNSINSSRSALAGLNSMHMDMVMNGYHGSPIAKLLTEGKFSFGFDGDLGALRGVKDNDPDLEKLGEFSLAYGGLFGSTWRIGAGRNEFRTRSSDNGTVNNRNNFVTSQVTMKLPLTDIYIDTLGFYGQSFNAVNRGYMNAGFGEISTAHANARNWGGRLRLDWFNLVETVRLGITPNISLNTFHQQFAAYTETGGSFHIQWQKADYATYDARLGIDGRLRLTDYATFLTRVEAVKRLKTNPAFAYGEVIGLGPIIAQNDPLQDHWFRIGLGAEFREGASFLSFMLNGSTENKGRAWANVGLRTVF